MIEFEPNTEYTANIKVVGIGGGGGNAVNTMVRSNIQGVEFILANTDVQTLDASPCQHKIRIGTELTRGLGAGSNPETGKMAAEESREHLYDVLEGSDMVFLTAGMGGGTGTGATPVIAEIAREVGALTVGVVTKPFLFEGSRRMKQAEEGIEELKESVDTLIVIPNQKLLSFIGKQTSLTTAFSQVDDVLQQAVCSISDLIVIPGLINLDFADVKTIMCGMGKALMGGGTASGENRAIEAAQRAISSPLLDEASVDGARGILINITGGEDLTLSDVNEAAMLIQKSAHEDAHIIFGAVVDKSMKDDMRVTVIATGFEKEERQPLFLAPQESISMPLKRVVNGECLEEARDEEKVYNQESLKELADSIRKESPETLSNSSNFDIPTFLRKHAD
ncbi:MAG: cell division protein FtsZ [Nitrospinaceae bacterium]|nr:cell division protein FtsZ [Nitrospinaceae bacterium]NIR57666.1 cell division protein FtsZ [Nitrospinaceae bacterium]NIS88141.1 cell division protein FtsZ [Nitrospinaceae bacterium]NIT85008.1 cell division protein FtsZ [Nitrospinaceae bacterium]NIU47177.1 cell division protein FtsZ [Nitrospinaceae bacterium]